MITMVQFTLILLIFLAVFAFAMIVRLILNRLNIRHLRNFGHSIPEDFEGFIDGKTLIRMRDYTVETSRISSIENVTGDMIVISLVLSGFFVWLSNQISALDLHIVISGTLFFLSCSLIMGTVEIPFDLYRNFVIEKKFSFSTLTMKLWLSDLFKSVLISLILLGSFLSILLSLIHFFPKTWWVWAWIFFICFQLLIMWLYPVVIAPLFNTFEPIENEELKTRISSVAQRSGITVSGLFRMDAGKRSRHSNAYFTGIGKTKRIVLFDTLLDTHTTEEIVAVLSHELGHWKMGHIKKQLILSMGVSLAALYLAYLLVNNHLLYSTFGFEGTSVYIGLFLLTIIVRPLAFFLTPLTSMLSRHFEQQADDYAFTLLGNTSPLVNALKQLAKENLSNLHPHPLYAWFYYSHPPLVERIERLKRTSRNK
ncbi:MAG: M48 family metallopeptidase [Deltaproteobacteria bacterium]|nr:M48 family metallopeptidase [Deltaproteobacteria bacterium]